MPPLRSRPTPKGLFNHDQNPIYSQMNSSPASNLGRFDPFSPKLKNLQDELKAARQALHEVELQLANERHQLSLDWDLISLAPETVRDRHNELAMEHKEWYRDLRNVHKLRINQLRLQIQKESDHTNWLRWTPIELLLRWKSGGMDYSVFKDPEATLRVREAFNLEAGLNLPDSQVIALVSAQVAAGWYRTPTESTDWISRDLEANFVDRDFPDDNTSTRSFYVPGPSLRNTAGQQSKSPGRAGPLRESRPYIYKPKSTLEYDQLESDEGSRRDVSRGEKPRSGQELESDPSYTELQQQNRSWASKYPRRDYSEEELEDILAKACAPDKPRKLVPMIAGRPYTRTMLAEEYID